MNKLISAYIIFLIFCLGVIWAWVTMFLSLFLLFFLKIKICVGLFSCGTVCVRKQEENNKTEKKWFSENKWN